nr:hypothetical protein [Curtobacterium pusillum]
MQLVDGEAIPMTLAVGPLIRDHQRVGTVSERDLVNALQEVLERDLIGRVVFPVAAPRLSLTKPLAVHRTEQDIDTCTANRVDHLFEGADPDTHGNFGPLLLAMEHQVRMDLGRSPDAVPLVQLGDDLVHPTRQLRGLQSISDDRPEPGEVAVAGLVDETQAHPSVLRTAGHCRPRTREGPGWIPPGAFGHAERGSGGVPSARHGNQPAVE